MISIAHAAAHDAVPFYAEAEFWVAAAFVLVVVLAVRPVLRAVAVGLDARANRIRAKLEEARSLREDAQALLALYQRKQRESQQEAEDLVARARVEAERLRREAAQALSEEIERRERQAGERIAQAEAQALADVRAMAVDLAMQAAAGLIRTALPPDRHVALIDETIALIPDKLGGESRRRG